MTWIRSSSGLTRNPKFFDLIARLKVGPRDAFWNLHHLWYWCSDHATDGVLKDVSDHVIALAAEWPGDPKAFVDALVLSGFMDRSDGALFLHDWDQWRSDPVRLQTRRTSDKRPTNVRRTSEQEEKRESGPLDGSSPAPPSPFSSLKERKEEVSASGAAALNSKTTKKKPIAYWSVLVDHIKRKWEYKKRDSKARFSPDAKDWPHLHRKALVYDVFELMALYDEFVTTDDAFYVKQGFSITCFCGAVNYLVDKRGWKAKADTYRAQHLKPTSSSEIEAAAKANTVVANLLQGKTLNAIDKSRVTLARTGAPRGV